MNPQTYSRIGLVVFSALFVNACGNLPKHDSTLTDDAKIVFAEDAFALKGENKLPDKWWLALNDSTLNQLIDQALKNNNNLKVGLLKIKKSRLSLQTTDANQAFKLDAKAGVSTSAAETSGKSTDTDKFSVGLVASYELDLWNKQSNLSASAALDITASELDYKTLRISTSADVALAWYRLVEQIQQLQLLKLQLTISEDYLQVIEQKFRTGQSLAADVLQQRQTVESVKGDHFNTYRLIQQYKNQLALLLAEPNFKQATPATLALPTLPALPKLGLKTELLHHRPDVQSAFNQLAKTDTQTAIAVAERFPKISLSANYERNGSDAGSLFDNWLASLAGNLIVPILDADKRALEVDKKKNLYQQALLNYKQKILSSVSEVQSALFKEDRQGQYLASLAKQLKLSEQATQQIRSSYIKGAMDFQRVLNAVLSDQNLQRNYLRANRELIEYRISLYRALSGGWEINNDK
jgi:NodT family efflux transporter outer membrane factor (OMF) lipoprotein